MTILIMLSIGISGLLYLFYDAAQVHFKMEAREEIGNKDHLQTIRLSLKDFNDLKENDEVWDNGKLYDIGNVVITGDSAIVSVLHDEKEEGLIKNIADSFEPNDKYSSDNLVHVCKHRIHMPGDGKVLVEKYTLEAFAVAIDSQPGTSVNKAYVSSVCHSVIKPPPRYVVA
jgi:hypothetical protein